MPRVARWIAFALILLVAGVVLFLSLRPRVVPVVEVARRPLEQRLVVTGRVLARSRIELGPLRAGNVAEVRVDVGDRVRKGDLLVLLDDVEERAAVAQARAALEEARARQSQLATVQLPRADAALRHAEAELEEARAQWERTSELHRRGAMSAAGLDDARRRLQQAEAMQRQALLARQGAAGGAEARVAAAAVANAEAALALAEARLARMSLLAPADGVVLAREVEPGDAVQPGSPLLVLAADGPMEIEIEPDERNLGQLGLGQQAIVSADAYPGERFPARVVRIGPGVDERRGVVAVRLAVDEPPAYLRPDMTVSADLELARKEDALVLPAEVVRERGRSEPWVLVIEEGRAVRRPVRLGLQGERYVEIVEGLSAGEVVIPESAGVEAGDRVRPREG